MIAVELEISASLRDCSVSVSFKDRLRLPYDGSMERPDCPGQYAFIRNGYNNTL